MPGETLTLQTLIQCHHKCIMRVWNFAKKHYSDEHLVGKGCEGGCGVDKGRSREMVRGILTPVSSSLRGYA